MTQGNVRDATIIILEGSTFKSNDHYATNKETNEASNIAEKKVMEMATKNESIVDITLNEVNNHVNASNNIEMVTRSYMLKLRQVFSNVQMNCVLMKNVTSCLSSFFLLERGTSRV